MLGTTRLSVRFVESRNTHQIRMLVNLTGEAPVRRPPINLALVLDRSGSMDGAPIHALRAAALGFTRHLGADDVISLVAFDETATTIYGPAAPDHVLLERAIRHLQAGGTTNLSGGWLMGLDHVRRQRVDGVNRVLLLTDGQANRGIVEPARMAGLAKDAAQRGVNTSCVGFGAHFNEDLLRLMASAAQGNWWYIEDVDRMGPILDEEIEGLVALAAQNVTVHIAFDHPGVAGVSVVQDLPVENSAEGWAIRLGDLYATSGRALGLVFHVENLAALGDVQLGTVTVSADVVREEGVEHRTIRMPVVARLTGSDQVEPEVESTLLRFEAAQARSQAVERADGGDLEGARSLLKDASARLEPLAADPAVREEIADLENQIQRLEARAWDAVDRKYNLARGRSVLDQKQAYLRKMRRRRD